MENNPLLTVVTPTYNRAYILDKCYLSLLRQTNQSFIWLVVDDGSTDNTEKIVRDWIADGRISIQYIKKQNGGKASALNRALDVITTKYAVCLDSDDSFYPETVDMALQALKAADQDERCCGVLALRNNSDGTVMGGREIPRRYQRVTAADVLLRLNLKTELICFYKTEDLKGRRFPEFENEKFVSPSWMQLEITRKKYFLTSWEKLCCCEYIADGLTVNKRKVILNNPKGYICVKKIQFELAPNLKQLVKNGIMYDCGCIIGHDSDWLKNAPHKIMAFLLYPMGKLAYWIRFQ